MQQAESRQQIITRRNEIEEDLIEMLRQTESDFSLH
jgi:hypothetical protein